MNYNNSYYPCPGVSFEEVFLKADIDLYVIDRIKEVRKNKGISQLDLANGIGVTAGFIGKVESNKSSSRYNLYHINKIAKYLGVSPREFMPKEAL